MTTADLIAYYQALLTIQYATKSKALATVSAFVGEAIADQVIAQVRDGFDPLVCTGKQLEVIGYYRGANRLAFGLNPGRQYFSMPAYADADIGTVMGFGIYSQGSLGITWYFLQYGDVNQLTYSLTDDELRRLIKFRAAVHGCNYGYGTLDAILFTFFGTNVNLIDTNNMHIEYHHNILDTDTLFSIVKINNSLPRPAGVAVAVTES